MTKRQKGKVVRITEKQRIAGRWTKASHWVDGDWFGLDIMLRKQTGEGEPPDTFAVKVRDHDLKEKIIDLLNENATASPTYNPRYCRPLRPFQLKLELECPNFGQDEESSEVLPQ